MDIRFNSHRLKRTPALRNLIKPPKLSPYNLVYPLFIKEETGANASLLPGIKYHPVEGAIKECEKILDLGINTILAFSVHDNCSSDASTGLEKDMLSCKAYEKIKEEFGDNIVIISDLCLCEFTESRECAFFNGQKMLLKESVEMLGKIALNQAQAGADVIAPAGMIDGQVNAIRNELDEGGYSHIPIMSYIKADSHLYDPYGVIVEKNHIKKKSASSMRRIEVDNFNLFAKKIELEISEGADILIIKPALPNLDIIRYAKERYTIPIAAYQVSGEYAMINAASQLNYLDENKLVKELISDITRAGADIIISYHAKQIAQHMEEY